MPFANHDGVEIYYESHGLGLPLVLLHAGSANGGIWLWQTLSFARSHRVIVIDHRGHGRSAKPTTGYAMATHARDVAAVLDALHIEQAVLVGNSLGGMIALQFNVDFPQRVLGNVLLSTGTGIANGMPVEAKAAFVAAFPASFTAFMQGSLGQRAMHERPELLEMLNAYHLVPSNYPAHAFRASFEDAAGPFAWDITDRLAELSAPCLVIAGDEDQVIPWSVSADLAARMPRADFRLIEGVGHFYQLEQPQAFNTACRAFLASLAPAAIGTSAPQ